MDDAPSGPSVRERIASLASDGALAVTGVTALDDGSDGVRCIAQTDGRYGVELGLIVEPVPLAPLAAAVRAAVQTTCADAGLRDQLGAVDIAIRDLATSSVDR